MQQQSISINSVVMSFMLGCLIFGFLAIGIAAAETVDDDVVNSLNSSQQVSNTMLHNQAVDHVYMGGDAS